MLTGISTKNAPAVVGPYSQAIEVNGFVFLSGQVAKTPKGDSITDSIETQTRQVMENLKAVLAEAGLDFTNVVRTEIFVTNMSDYAIVNKVYESFLSEPYPARFTVGVKELPAGFNVEIAMIAAR
jgi:2-iminobutanoate/2-iminopropanoate deaminase